MRWWIRLRGPGRVLGLVVAGLAAGVPVGAGARAEEWADAERPIAAVVDHYVDQRLAKAGVTAAPEADDATLVRRLTLDLLGRIPTPAEVRAYGVATDPEKRERLVDRLMATPGFARNQAEAFDALLMAGAKGSLRAYLVKAFGEQGRTWDEVFRTLLVADESAPEGKGTAEFVKARAKDLDRLTSDVSSIFFGVNVSCAKCHDHPRVSGWTQDLFYGMKSFVGRTYLNGSFVGERDYGTVTYKTTGGEERPARFLFLGGRAVEMPGLAEPPAEVRKEEKRRLAEAKAKNVPPPPAVSARARLVEVALEPETREYFARAIVNRLWHRYFGVGLVMPLDQMHAENPPSHPELLGWLARDLIAHRYDLRRTIRGLVLSRAYARSSRWEPESTAGSSPGAAEAEAPDPRLFALAALRPLSPMQLATSMWVATSDPASFPEDASPEALDPRIEALEGRARALAGAIARPGEDYQIGASEALLLSNGAPLRELLADGDDRLVGRLARIGDRREQIELAVRTVLSRVPDDEEVALLDAYLAGRADRPVEGCRQLVWSLLTGSEFRFNY